MIYALNFKTVYFLILIGIGSWVFLWRWLKGQERFWGLLNVFLCLIALYFVLKYTVLHRISSNNHQFMIFAPRNSEFYREMLMNAFLFYPFGLTLTVLIGPWSILVAFVLSFGIETWQYIAGTGVAQVSDVMMNTLGCVMGAIPYLVRFLWNEFLKKREFI